MAELATREQLLSQARRRFAETTLPVSGLRIRYQSLMAGELEEFYAEMQQRGGGLRKDRLADAKRRLLQRSIVDKDGNLLLSPADVGTLKGWDGADVNAAYDEIARHCGLVAGDVDVAVGNSNGVHEE